MMNDNSGIDSRDINMEIFNNFNQNKGRGGKMIDKTREELAEYAHIAWSGWMIYLFEKSLEVGDGCAEIPKWAVERWTRQANTAYKDLPEDEKESDRTEADRMIDIYESENDAKKVAKFIADITIKDSEVKAENKQLENLIRDMLFDIPVIPDRHKYVERLKEIK